MHLRVRMLFEMAVAAFVCGCGDTPSGFRGNPADPGDPGDCADAADSAERAKSLPNGPPAAIRDAGLSASNLGRRSSAARCPAGFESDESNTCAKWELAPSTWPTFGEHVATLLRDGRVLILGSVLEDIAAHGAVFDPRSDRWDLLQNGPSPLFGRTATPLLDESIFVVGGIDDRTPAAAEAWLFQPATMQWLNLPSMAAGRAYHSATRLHDGRVLVTGGQPDRSDNEILASVEIFDPATQRWTTASPMRNPRTRHTASIVGDEVVVVGGLGTEPGKLTPHALATTEVYDFPSNMWEFFGTLGAPVFAHTMTAWQPGGQLLVVSTTVGSVSKSSYSHWEATFGAMHWKRSGHVAVQLRDGRVLVAGGTPYQELRTPEIYDPRTRTWTKSVEHPMPIFGGTATLLGDGRVLVISAQALLFVTTLAH